VPLTPKATESVTELLRLWGKGDPLAQDRLASRVYVDLRRMAKHQLRRECQDGVLNPSDLVHESYVRLLRQAGGFENRAHFFALATILMRRVLVDLARKRRADRRGGGGPNLTIDVAQVMSVSPISADVLALDRALEELADQDPEAARIVELHFFGGLTFTEIAESLGISESSVFREWRMARLWLLKRLSG
jgi:RNA polymerase sigma-70 factor, ECF subfamily